MKIALVSCGKAKKKVRSRAEDLYTGPPFRAARNYARRRFDSWYILSALHTVLAPSDEIEPYELTLKGMTEEAKSEWGKQVVKKLRDLGLVKAKFVVLAGEEYITPLRDAGLVFDDPLAGMNLYERMPWLASQ